MMATSISTAVQIPNERPAQTVLYWELKKALMNASNLKVDATQTLVVNIVRCVFHFNCIAR